MIVLGGGLETDVELYYDHVYALKGVSLSVSQGETVALIGALSDKTNFRRSGLFRSLAV